MILFQAVWLFGGEHHVEHDQPALKNDLWRLDLDTWKWSLVHNGTAGNMSTVPESRQLASACGIQNSYFVLFGGLNEHEEALSDTWIYYMKDKKWYKLNEIREKLMYSHENEGEYPGPKGDASSWCYNYTYMFVFGGFGKEQQLSHEMWKFDLEELTWKQTESSEKLPKDGDFVKYLPYPRGRSGTTKWTVEDELYMFGGNIMDKNVRSKHLMIGNSGDLWKYSIRNDKWTYLMGPQEPCKQATNYGSKGKASPESYPGCRRQAASWVDLHNNLWMFGGDGIDNSQESLSVFTHSRLLSDLWYYDVDNWLWTWKGGSEAGDRQGNYGNVGKSSDHTIPGSRCESVSWGNASIFYLFGGVGHDGNGKDGYLNDIWKLDVSHDAAILQNAPEPAQVFAVIIVGISLVAILSFIFVLLRGSFADNQKEKSRGKYKRLDQEELVQ